jgi:hypothetical protein
MKRTTAALERHKPYLIHHRAMDACMSLRRCSSERRTDAPVGVLPCCLQKRVLEAGPLAPLNPRRALRRCQESIYAEDQVLVHLVRMFRFADGCERRLLAETAWKTCDFTGIQ